jgi:hypothetical protein
MSQESCRIILSCYFIGQKSSINISTKKIGSYHLSAPAFAPMAGGGIGALPMQVVTDNKLYCVCQSVHDDVSEMIGCDAPDCQIEWFHFECVGIMVAQEGQWNCPKYTKRYNIQANY